MAEPITPTPLVTLPTGFTFGPALVHPAITGPPTPPADLGPLNAFVGTWSGSGFNTIFRPDSPQTPTSLPIPAGGDNILELNLTSETLSFSPSLGRVPNRGMVQSDAFLNGVPYLQAISDVTTSPSTGIHVEPGLWMAVPTTQDPPEGPTLVRMASIPHGTTILAQGSSTDFIGPPSIPAVSITPGGAVAPGAPLVAGPPFPSQTAASPGTARLPQDLTPFITAGTITQAMLDDPNSVLRNHNSGLTITGGTALSVATVPPEPLFGGGPRNIAFLLGDQAAMTDPRPPGQNAQTVELTATFWIEAVQHTVIVPPFEPGRTPLVLPPEGVRAGQPAPSFLIQPPIPIPVPRPITVLSTQIQYSQTVMLNFNGLTWPHVSVATLVPAGAVTVPPSAWE